MVHVATGYDAAGHRDPTRTVEGLRSDRLGLAGQQLPQHILQNPAVSVVQRFLRSIDAHQSFELDRSVPHFWPGLPEVGIFQQGKSRPYAPTGWGFVASNCRNTYCKIPPLA